MSTAIEKTLYQHHIAEFVFLHFLYKDFSVTPKQRKLLPHAWPKLCSNLPSYMVKQISTSQQIDVSVSERLKLENDLIKALNEKC